MGSKSKAQRGEISSFSIYGKRQEDGSIEIGHSGSTRNVDSWPVEMSLDGHYMSYGLEYVEKQTTEGVEEFRNVDEIPDEPGLEWGVYM